MAFEFEKLASGGDCDARLGRIRTGHGSFETPVFMPVGTRATVKALTQEMLEQAGASIVLANTYHLYLRPGRTAINRLGGLHGFMSWPWPVLTDSGGFQVFSLSDLGKVGEAGVEFRSHLDGSTHLMTPEVSIEIQVALGGDILMAFDECTPFPCDRGQALESLRLTGRWAARSKARFDRLHSSPEEAGQSGFSVVNPGQALFGINQGSIYPDLRIASLDTLLEIGFDGYAIGGLSVGESKEEMFQIVTEIAPRLPDDRPRYLMGVGLPEDIVEAVSRGVDMFDCVMPTRNARNGQAFTRLGRLNLKNARYKLDQGPIDDNCGCPCCRRYSRAYLRHLYASGEILGSVLLTLHNVWFYLDMMRDIRQAMRLGTFVEFRHSFLNDLANGPDSN